MPANLISMLEAWSRVLTKPGAQTFAVLRSRSTATLPNALMLNLLVGVISALLSILLATLSGLWAIPPSAVESFEPPYFLIGITRPLFYVQHELYLFYSGMEELYGKLWFHTGLFDLYGNSVLHAFHRIFGLPSWLQELVEGFSGPARFFLLLVVYNRVAILLGGRGQFGRFAFLVAAVGATMASINVIFDFLPLAAGVIVAALPGSSLMLGQNWYYLLTGMGSLSISLIETAYWFFLFYFPMRIEHGLTWWRAVAGVVFSYLLFFVLETFVPYGVPFGVYEAAHLVRLRG